MRLTRWKSLRSFRCFMSLCFSFLSFIVLTSLQSSPVLAQTPTTGFTTSTPGATSTPYGAAAGVVKISFVSDDQGFTGTGSNGVDGWCDASGSLDIHGSSTYEANKLVFAVHHPNEAGEIIVTLKLAGDVVLNQDGGWSSQPFGAPETAFINLDLGGSVSFDEMRVQYDGSSVFCLSSVSVYTSSGAAWSGSVDGNGCPVLTSDEQAALDPLYFQQCIRCFGGEPVAANEHPLGTPEVSWADTGTPWDSGYNLTIFSSGTPMTTTPIHVGGGGGGGGATSTPAPTATPGTQSQYYDFRVSQYGAVAAAPFPAWLGASSFDNTPGSANWSSGSGYESVWTNDYYSTYDAESFAIKFNSSWTHLDHPDELDIFYDDFPPAVRLSYTSGATSVTAGSPISAPGFGGSEVFFINSDAAHDFTNAVIFGGFLTGAPSPVHITGVRWYWTGSPDPTATPVSTSTVAPVFQYSSSTPSTCDVPRFRDMTPMIDVQGGLSIHEYDCYTVVPDVSITIPGRGDVGIDGLQICVTWYDLPQVTVPMVGIVISLDWLLLPLGLWLVERLLSF